MFVSDSYRYEHNLLGLYCIIFLVRENVYIATQINVPIVNIVIVGNIYDTICVPVEATLNFAVALFSSASRMAAELF